MNKNRDKYKSFAFWLIFAFLGGYFLYLPTPAYTQDSPPSGKDPEVQDLAQQIKEQRDAIEELQEKVRTYEKQLQARQNQSLTIKNELETLEDRISQIRIQLDIKRREITEINLKIKEAEKRIAEKNAEIVKHKDQLSEFVRLLYQKKQKSPVEIVLANDAFSEYFDQVKYTQAIEEDLGGLLKKIKTIKEKLELDHKGLLEQQKELEKLRDELTETQLGLEDNLTAKNVLLAATEADEVKFQKLLAEVRAEQARMNADIVSMERLLRAKLEASGDKSLSDLSGQKFIWPVPSRYVTARFHDPNYPFRRYFEHPAIDIRAKQGTSIQAIASGYVARAADNGMGYSYISIVHADGLSSVYGHVSCILVQEDEFVVQGQVIGCTGATPGTPGAGNLTTGPHLHLEVRLNGVPVNPESHLP